MAVNLSALAGAGQQFFDNSGVILSGGKLYSYAAGTTTPQATYTSASGSTAHTNPIILNSAGRVATGEIWLTAGSNYKFALYTSTDVLITTWDNITGINGTGITSNASNVTYDPAGTGAVSTTVQAKLRQTVSVKDFGATGNGSTDDTAAIQAALNSGALSIYAPAGTYKVTSTINITRPVTFYGDGLANTIFSQATNFDVFYIYDGVGVMLGVNMFNFGITNTQARASVTSGAGIKLYKVYFSQFSNITITNTYIGIDSTQSNVTKYNGVNVTSFNYVGYWFHGGFNFDSYVANCSISGGGAGFASVYLQDMCDEMTFYSVIMNVSQYNVYTDATAYGVNLRPEFCRFFACSFDSATDGVFLRRCTDMTFTGCLFSTRPGNGLQIGTTAVTENIVFVGCTFAYNGSSGAIIGEFALYTVFDNCNFIGNSTAVANAANGLTVAANTTNFTVTNCNFRNGCTCS
jgi:hypothetical protein